MKGHNWEFIFCDVFSPPLSSFPFVSIFSYSLSLSAPSLLHCRDAAPSIQLGTLGVVLVSHRSPGRTAGTLAAKCILRVLRAHGTRRVAATVDLRYHCYVEQNLKTEGNVYFKLFFSVIICQHVTSWVF